jgi:hypothetical protein
MKPLELSPQNERESWLRSTALGLSNDLGGFRWLKYSGADGRIQWPFLAILTLDLDTPNRGLLQMSSAPLQLALEQIGPLDPPLPARP